mmetsp:Transcript_33873/g.103974  ORF Transcript_33873/g.103974 Transcript_33873/m.103974 type:complete len:271 (-) Transcript_33873:29-841(-)
MRLSRGPDRAPLAVRAPSPRPDVFRRGVVGGRHRRGRREAGVVEIRHLRVLSPGRAGGARHAVGRRGALVLRVPRVDRRLLSFSAGAHSKLGEMPRPRDRLLLLRVLLAARGGARGRRGPDVAAVPQRALGGRGRRRHPKAGAAVAGVVGRERPGGGAPEAPAPGRDAAAVHRGAAGGGAGEGGGVRLGVSPSRGAGKRELGPRRERERAAAPVVDERLPPVVRGPVALGAQRPRRLHVLVAGDAAAAALFESLTRAAARPRMPPPRPFH